MRLKTAFPAGLCGAKTQAGHPCRSLNVRLCLNGKLRCKWHGMYNINRTYTPESLAKITLSLKGVRSGGPRRPEAKAKVTQNLRNTPTWKKMRERLGRELEANLLEDDPLDAALNNIREAKTPAGYLEARSGLNRVLNAQAQAELRKQAAAKGAATRRANREREKALKERLERAQQRIAEHEASKKDGA